MEKIVRISNINKSFGTVQVLHGVDFELCSGEVVALLGENGAGKSTMVKIISGVYTRDSGNLELFNKPIKEWDTNLAKKHGVSIIHQELNMCGHLSVCENMFLGRERKSVGLLKKQEMRNIAKKYFQWLGVDIDVNQAVDNLSLAMKQMVEIAKALSQNAKVLIMDEPTSALTASEIEKLFLVINRLKADGVGIVYISHRLDELQHIATRVAIMRDGKMIGSYLFNKDNLDFYIAQMVGREITDKYPRVECEVGDIVLKVDNLNSGNLVKDISFELCKGEIVGIAGLMGAGRTETTRAIFGIDKKTSGDISLNGKTIKIKKPLDAIKAGVVLAPEDRKKDGLCTRLSVGSNIVLPNFDLVSTASWINSKKSKKMIDNTVSNLKIKAASVGIDVASLSGGNQQKIVIGKWLARNAKVVIFDEPTRGVDIGAKVEIYNIINSLKLAGVAVLVISSELQEVMGISDRILVMCDGRITGQMLAKDATQEKIMKLATKFENKLQINKEIN